MAFTDEYIDEYFQSKSLIRQNQAEIIDFPLKTKHHLIWPMFKILPVTIYVSSSENQKDFFLSSALNRKNRFLKSTENSQNENLEFHAVYPSCIDKKMALNPVGGGYESHSRRIYLIRRKIVLNKDDSRRYHDFLNHQPQSERDKEIALKIHEFVMDCQNVANNLDVSIAHEKRHAQNDRFARQSYLKPKWRGVLSRDEIMRLRVLDELSAYTCNLMDSRNEYLKNPTEENLKLFDWCLDFKKELEKYSPNERKAYLENEEACFKNFEKIFYHGIFFNSHLKQFLSLNQAQEKVVRKEDQIFSTFSGKVLFKTIKNAFMTFPIYSSEDGTEKNVLFHPSEKLNTLTCRHLNDLISEPQEIRRFVKEQER